MYTCSHRPLDLFGKWNLATNNFLLNEYYATIITFHTLAGSALCENICESSHCCQIRDVRRTIFLSVCAFVPNRAFYEATIWMALSFPRSCTKFISNAIYTLYKLGETRTHSTHIPGTSSISIAGVDSVVNDDVVVSAAFEVGEGIFRVLLI